MLSQIKQPPFVSVSSIVFTGSLLVGSSGKSRSVGDENEIKKHRLVNVFLWQLLPGGLHGWFSTHQPS